MITFKQFIQEGGNAIKGIVPVKQSWVKLIITDIQKRLLPKLGLTTNDMRLLGSAGKKYPDELSGDIDIALYYPAIIQNNPNIDTIDKVFLFIANQLQQLTSGVKVSQSISVISCGWPVPNETNTFVQVDFMLTDDLNFAEFRFYSPAQWESKYKGVYRTVLLLIILKVISKQILETTPEGEPLTWKRLFIDAQKGLVEITQTRKGKTSKLLKNIKTIDRRVITKDVNQILEYMFGKGIKPKDVGSFEQIWHLIHQPNWQYRAKLNEIIKEYKQKLIDIGLPLPDEMKGV